MRWILFAVAAPYAVPVGWGWVLLMCAIGAARDLRWGEYIQPRQELAGAGPYRDGLVTGSGARWSGRLHATWRPWVRRIGWRWSTTLGFGTILQPRHAERRVLLVHEWIHTEQVEDLMFLSLVIGLIGAVASWDPWLGAGIYVSGGVWQLPNFVTAWLRGDDPYRGALHERHPYSEADEYDDHASDR